MQSNYFSRLRGAIRQGVLRSISSKESGTHNEVAVLITQGKVLHSHSRHFSSLLSGNSNNLHVIVRSSTVAAAQANLQIANRRKNLSVIGAFSPPISIPSVSGPSFQVCGYHIDCLLLEPNRSLINNSRKAHMAVSALSTVTYQPAQPGVTAYHSFRGYSKKRFDSCGKVSMSLRNKDQPNNFLLYGYFIYNVAKRKGNGNPFFGFGFEGFHTSSRAHSSDVTAREVCFGNSMREAQHSGSADSSELNIPVERTLKLNSASCYLPHPDKEETGGEDAHFICPDEQALGIADGVGGWADVGVDAGLYARKLMSNSVIAIRDEPKGSIDPARVLEKAHSHTKAKGSSTACIMALTDRGLHAVNLGDSGFMVVRDGCTVFRSPVQQHDFNFPYQLERGKSGDLPSSGQVLTVPVAPGDVIIAGTDGLFDNLYNSDITAIVVHSVRAGLGPQVTAQKVAALARQRAKNRKRQTPFSTAAQEAGLRYYGGKLDDITVVVSYITSDIIGKESREKDRIGIEKAVQPTALSREISIL